MVNGFSSIDPSQARGPQISAGEATRRRRSRGTSSRGRSTLLTPTPGAGELTGTAAERESQIAAFRSGGKTALVKERKKAEARIAKVEAQRQETIQARTIAGQLETKESPGFRIGLSERERAMTTREVVAGRFGEIGTGIAKAAVSIGEGGFGLISSLGIQTLRQGETPSFFGPGIDLGKRSERIKEIKEAPTGTGAALGQALVLAPAIGAGIAGFATSAAAVGGRAAVVETVTSLSPFRIPTQTFGSLASGRDLRFDVVSRRTKVDGKTLRTVTGRARDFDDVFLVSRQVSRTTPTGEVGRATTTITAPETTFRAGRFTEGIRTIRTESVFGGVAGTPTGFRASGITARGVGFEGVRGSTGDVFTRTVADVLIDERGAAEAGLTLGGQFTRRAIGGVSRQLDSGGTIFAAGPAQRGIVITPRGVSPRARISDISVRGIEVDLTRGLGGGAGTTIIGRGPSTKLVSDTAARQVSAAISAIPTTQASAGISVAPLTVSSLIATTTQVSPVVPIQAPRQQPRQVSPQILSTVPLVSTDQLRIDTPVSITRSRADTRQAAAQTPISLVQPTEAFQPVQRPGQKTGQIITPTEGLGIGAAAPPVLGFSPFDVSPSATRGLALPTISGFFPSGRRPSGRTLPGFDIAPSFTGVALFGVEGITGPELDIGGTLGRSPFDIRLVPGRPRRKSKKKKK